MDVLHLHSPPVITTKVPLHPVSSEVLGEVGWGGLVIPIFGSSSDVRMVFVRCHGCPHPISSRQMLISPWTKCACHILLLREGPADWNAGWIWGSLLGPQEGRLSNKIMGAWVPEDCRTSIAALSWCFRPSSCLNYLHLRSHLKHPSPF